MPSAPQVLIVDDEAHVRTYLRMLVREAFGAATVLDAADAETALQHCAASPLDLVLLDINLVGVSGLEVLRRIRAGNAALPVVMLTAVNIRHTVEEALAAGATGYLLKELPSEELVTALREMLPGRHSAQTPETTT